MAKRLNIRLSSLKGSWLLSCFGIGLSNNSNDSNRRNDNNDEIDDMMMIMKRRCLSLDEMSTSSLDNLCIVDPVACDYVVDNDDVIDENGCLRTNPSINIISIHKREASSATSISSFSLDDDADDE